MKSFKAIISLVAITLTVGITGIPVAAQEPVTVNEIIVRVNNDIITLIGYEGGKKELESELKAKNLPPDQFKEELAKGTAELLQNMIDERLLIQKARQLDIDVEAQVNKQWIQLANQNGAKSIKEFEDKLRESGISPEAARDSIKVGLLRDQVLREEVFGPVYRLITEPEARDFYTKNIEKFSSPAEVSLSEIYVGLSGRSSAEADTVAKQAVAEARRGVDFKSLVQKYSDASRKSSQNGGFVGAILVDQLEDNIRPAIAKLKAGEVTDPLFSKNQGGVIVYRADAVKPSVARPFEEVKDQIYNYLAYDKGSKNIEDYIKKLRKRAYISVTNGYENLLASNSETATPAADKSANKKP